MSLERTLDLLARLVAFPTESSQSNRALIDFVAAEFARHGVDFVISPNPLGDKAAILATIGPRIDGGVVLSGHTDVVPVAGQTWTSDPFTLRITDGRAYGRGAVDMKGFVALCLAALPQICAARLTRPLHLLFSYDEETTCLGSLDLIARFGKDQPRPAAVIVGEPTSLEVADAHKSVVTFDTSVHGFEVHSSKPERGANAVAAAAHLIVELDRIAEDVARLGDPTGCFDPPHTTVHVGTVHGGTARNIVPKLCRFNWEYRGVPGLDNRALVIGRFERYAQDIVLPKLRRGHADARIETVNEVDVHGLRPEPGSAAEQLALAVAGRNHTITVPYGTEAGGFQNAGIPTVICGPGSIDQAHQPDEYITLDALAAGESFFQRLIARLS